MKSKIEKTINQAEAILYDRWLKNESGLGNNGKEMILWAYLRNDGVLEVHAAEDHLSNMLIYANTINELIKHTLKK